MDKVIDEIDLTVLPADARKEIMDLYLFLKKKYSVSAKKKDVKLPDEFFKPIIVKKYLKINREEIYQNV